MNIQLRECKHTTVTRKFTKQVSTFKISAVQSVLHLPPLMGQALQMLARPLGKCCCCMALLAATTKLGVNLVTVAHVMAFSYLSVMTVQRCTRANSFIRGHSALWHIVIKRTRELTVEFERKIYTQPHLHKVAEDDGGQKGRIER